MDSTIKIQSKIHNYNVNFLEKIENQLNLQNYDLIVIDANVFAIYKSLFQKGDPLLVSISENTKNMTTVIDLLKNFELKGIKRSSKVLFIGGGCLQDVATVTSSLYMRGVVWDFVPTTLQSMADSCIGGKSSINSDNQKNIIGNYFPPTNIYISTEFISTLPKIEIYSGLIEIIKIFYARNPNFEIIHISALIEEIISTNQKQIDYMRFKKVIYESLLAKKYFIELDEFDHGLRKLLNFGHTFGHAIEIYSKLKINHGTAVGIGMLCAYELSKILNSKHAFILENLIYKILFENAEIYRFFETNIDTKEFIKILNLDKKSTKSSLNFIVPDVNGLKIIEVFNDQNFSFILEKIFTNISSKLKYREN